MKEHIKDAKYVLQYLKGTKEQVWWKFRCWVDWILTQIGVKMEMIITPHQDTSSWWLMVKYLGHLSNKNSCIVSGRSWIYGTSQHRMTSCLAWIFQRRNRVPYWRTNTTMLGQSSCDILNDKSSSRTSNETYRHTTSLYSGTVRRKGRWTFSCRWRRKPSRPVHQVLACRKSGEI